MGYTLDARGKPTFDDEADPQVDLQASADWADKVGAGIRGTRAERLLLTSSDIQAGQTYAETDTGLVYLRLSGGWKCITTGPLAVDTVFDVSGTVPTTATAVAGLSIPGADTPVGVPCLLRITVHANNAGSGGTRWIEFRAFDGATGLDTFRRLTLTYLSLEAWKYNGSLLIPFTPAGGALTLQVRADQAASVTLEHAALEVMVAPS